METLNLYFAVTPKDTRESRRAYCPVSPLSPPPAGIKSKGLKMGKVIKGRRKGSKRNERSYIVGSTKRQHFIKTIQIYMNKTQKYVIITKWGRKSTIYQTCGEEIAFG